MKGFEKEMQKYKLQPIKLQVKNAIELCEYNIETMNALFNDIADDVLSPSSKNALICAIDMVKHRSLIIKESLNNIKETPTA